MPPEGVVEKGLPAVETYLSDVLKAEQAGAQVKSLQQLKVVLVGSSQAGKTSLVNSIVKGHRFTTVGTAAEVSTVGIEILRHKLKGTSVEFYDCAGQVDYDGLHQTFLTRHALFLLVFDVSRCHGKPDDSVDEVVFQDILKWLFALQLRAPGSTVILVANKCDGSIENYTGTVEIVEKRVRKQLKERQDLRGIPGRPAPRMAEVTWLHQASLVSCQDGGGLQKMIDRVAAHGATSMRVPPAWGLALAFLDALRDSRRPLQAAREYLGLDSSPEVGEDSKRENSFITERALSDRWFGVVQRVEGELRSEAEKMAVSDPSSAIEGALWISEFAGQIVRIGKGGGIFLDVVWLSTALKPILDHKLRDEVFPQEFTNMRDELVHNGILCVKFAEHLWGRVMGSPPTESVLDALCRVVLTLGVALPLEPANLSTARNSAYSTSRRPDHGPQDMLVIMRLPETCGTTKQQELDRLISDTKDRHGGREVTFKWRFDIAGPPYSLVERVIASCHTVGNVQMGLCWRYGAVFKSRAMARGGGPDRLYTLVIRYDDTVGDERRVLTVRMFGPQEDDRVWAALRWVASSVVNNLGDWAGVLCEGWPECADHPTERVYFTTPNEARIGGLLLPDDVLGDICRGCDCHRIEGDVLNLVLKRLGNVVDTRTGGIEGDPFGDVDQEEPVSMVLPSDPSPHVDQEEPVCACCSEAFTVLEPSALKAAAWSWGVSVIFLGGFFALKEVDPTGWKICLGIMGLFLLGAVVASLVACRYKMRMAREERARRASGQQGSPV